MRQKGTLLKVLWINAVMFVLIAGARPTAFDGAAVRQPRQSRRHADLG